MYCYSVYGLGILSALPLPELIAVTERKADVVIRLGKIDPVPPEIVGTGSHFRIGAKEAVFFWDQVGAFLVRGGQEIIVDPRPGVEERVIHLPLLGVVLAELLHQRGALVLHGSAVSVDGLAVAFLGNKRSGKSTVAAALYARGHQLVTDDVIVLGVNKSKNPTVLPAFPQLKLWPEAVAASLGDAPEDLPRLHSQVEKRVRQVISGFARRPVPLRHIYVLDRGSSPEIESLRSREAMIQLIANSHAARFDQPLRQNRGVSHFLQCAGLAKDIPTYRLKRPPSLTLLPAIARLVEEHLAGGTYDVSV